MPIVLLHGFTLTGRSWDPVLERLEGAEAVAPDLRGHGDARDRRPIDFASVSADVAAAAPEGAILCGYSLGGRVALRAAVDHPGRFGRLVLIGASPGIADRSEREARRRADEALAERAEAMTMEAFAHEWEQHDVFAGQPPDVRALVRTDRLRNDPRALAAALRGLGTGVMEPLWDRLGQLDVPVTLVVGERDHKFVAIARRMAERIADAELVVADGGGHAVHLERPEAVAELLRGP
jgi:2-succinyl-6-hydroxy-2,4-cyclohexadiene-1-carboxylate synthase